MFTLCINNLVDFVAGNHVNNVCTHAAAAASRRVDEDAVIDCDGDGLGLGDGGDGAWDGQPDGQRQRDLGLPEEHAEPEGRPQRLAR